MQINSSKDGHVRSFTRPCSDSKVRRLISRYSDLDHKECLVIYLDAKYLRCMRQVFHICMFLSSMRCTIYLDVSVSPKDRFFQVDYMDQIFAGINKINGDFRLNTDYHEGAGIVSGLNMPFMTNFRRFLRKSKTLILPDLEIDAGSVRSVFGINNTVTRLEFSISEKTHPFPLTEFRHLEYLAIDIEPGCSDKFRYFWTRDLPDIKDFHLEWRETTDYATLKSMTMRAYGFLLKLIPLLKSLESLDLKFDWKHLSLDMLSLFIPRIKTLPRLISVAFDKIAVSSFRKLLTIPNLKFISGHISGVDTDLSTLYRCLPLEIFKPLMDDHPSLLKVSDYSSPIDGYFTYQAYDGHRRAQLAALTVASLSKRIPCGPREFWYLIAYRLFLTYKHPIWTR
jgi:hypothetical protein